MGEVYKITDGVLNYYGSTEGNLNQRLINHRTPSNNCSTNKLNRDNLTIESVEFCEDTRDLKKREAWWIGNNECVNINKPFRTKEEKNALHRARCKKYYEAHKDRALVSNVKSRIKTGQYDKITCGCGSIINKCEMYRHKKSKKHINYLKSIP